MNVPHTHSKEKLDPLPSAFALAPTAPENRRPAPLNKDPDRPPHKLARQSPERLASRVVALCQLVEGDDGVALACALDVGLDLGGVFVRRRRVDVGFVVVGGFFFFP